MVTTRRRNVAASARVLAALFATLGSALPGVSAESFAVAADTVHAVALAGDRFPSAEACRTCHPKHYREWSVSQHAYAQLSPVFNSMQATVNRLTNGTNGDFCIRCHTPHGMALEEPLFMPNLERSDVAREGVTCVVCHRINANAGKFSARMHLVEGDLHQSVFGPTGGEELQRVLADDSFRLAPTAGQRPGRPVHGKAERFFEISTPSFCGTCHDVTLPDGFRLEEAFSEYKTSPAARRGTTCQDCHMGIEPGDPDVGYEEGPAAIVGGVPTRTRKLTNHMIVGPDHSVIHPALFPHQPRVTELASLSDWLLFDHEAGWGEDEFEDAAADDVSFAPPWDSIDARYDARELIDEQLDLLAEADARGTALLRRGYRLGEIEIERASERGLRFRVPVRNGVDSHNVPTGFVAERLVFLRVTVTDSTGKVLFRSGDLDSTGDLRDLHSPLVHAGEVPRDRQLFSLQSKFLTRNLRGGEREQVLAVNHSVDVLPFVRPESVPTVLTGRPRGARIHKVGVRPAATRWAEYRVRRSELTGHAPYRIDVDLVAGMVPVNLIREIQGVGFDYGLSAREIADAVVAGHRTLWSRSVTVDPGPGG